MSSMDREFPWIRKDHPFLYPFLLLAWELAPAVIPISLAVGAFFLVQYVARCWGGG